MEFSSIKGLGQKKAELLKKSGFSAPEDLVFFFPKKYIDTNNLSAIKAVKTGDEAVFCGKLASIPVRKTVRRGLFFVKAEFLLTSLEKISCIWFNNAYIKTSLKPEKTYYITGKVKRSGSRVEISAPELYDSDTDLKVIPVYRKISGFSQASIRALISEIIKNVEIKGFIPHEIAREFGILPLSDTVKTLHKPCTLQAAEAAKKSAALEMLACDLAVFFLHKDASDYSRLIFYHDKTPELNEFISSKLPYSLTKSQQKCLDEIMASLKSGQRMNRLISGDVGSGKTVVALISAYFAYLNGYQSVLMAPTEILARQHFRTAQSILGEAGVRVSLLTGSQTKSERADKLFNIANGLSDFVIGTHALISDEVEFKNLSLVITDEQQRFGVGQRGKLENKAEKADSLILSATPIPRTLSLILYGELGQSTLERIDTRRAKVTTKLVPHHKIEDMYGYVAQKAAGGEKTYIVCPRIEDDEDDELFSLKEVFSHLKKRTDLATYISLIHGQMKDDEKNRIMEDFCTGKTRVLVATTVIEVGIDVSDATTIIIFNPERYGLSQLHQLRGRVGRGSLDSYCFLVTSEDNSALERLEFFLSTNDGFALAEYDFESRGAGDFIGTRQHGGSSIGCGINAKTIETAKTIAQKLMQNPETKAALIKSITTDKQTYIKNLTLS